MITTGAYYSTTRTQQTVYTKISLAACAFHANTAVFAYLFVTFVAMLSALFADQSAAFTMVASGANYRAIRAQITSITKIFFAARALVAHTAVNAELTVTIRTMLVAFGTEFGAPFASCAASHTDYRTIGAQTAVITEGSFAARALVASSAVETKLVMTLRTVFSA